MASFYKTMSLDNGPFFIYIKLKIPVLKVSQLLSEIQQKKILVNILMVLDSNVLQSQST